MPNYSKSIIYKLECKDPDVTEIYVGATTNFYNRKKEHKRCCINKDGKIKCRYTKVTLNIFQKMNIYVKITEYIFYNRFQFLIYNFIRILAASPLTSCRYNYILYYLPS